MKRSGCFKKWQFSLYKTTQTAKHIRWKMATKKPLIFHLILCYMKYILLYFIFFLWSNIELTFKNNIYRIWNMNVESVALYVGVEVIKNHRVLWSWASNKHHQNRLSTWFDTIRSFMCFIFFIYFICATKYVSCCEYFKCCS